MKFAPVLFLAILVISCTGPAGADSPMLNGGCHNVDMYGIYKICDAPETRHHEERSQTVIQPVYVDIPQPFAAPAPAPAPPIQSEPAPDSDSPHRDLTAVDAKLHALNLLVDEKQTRGELEAKFADEELRYLAQIAQREQSAADMNGGYLSVAQENSLLAQLQDIENEINRAISSNG